MSIERSFKPHEKALIVGSIFHMSVEQVANLLGKEPALVEQYLQHLCPNRASLEKSVKEMFKAQSLRRIFSQEEKSGGKKRGSHGNVIGYREDLGLTLRSKMEANVARWLDYVLGRDAWEHEPVTIEFIPTPKVGPRRYIPDFIVRPPHATASPRVDPQLPQWASIVEDEEFIIETKGRFLRGDISRIRNFRKQHPNWRLVMVTYKSSKKVIEYCQKKGITVWLYDDIRQQFESVCEHWE